MLTLITGRPGTGKTQYAIARFIVEERKDNPARAIFSNIKGLKLDKLQALTGGDLVGPAPDDWRDLPDGSLVIYDEAQQENLFPATGKPGAPSDERLLRLDTHRHRGFDIVLISQDASLVHHWARKFVGRFIHLERHDGLESTNVNQWEEVVDPSDYHAKQRADKSTRSMDKSIWDVYDSATVHTHKFKVPAGAKGALRFALFLAVAFSVIAWFMWDAVVGDLTAQQSSNPQIETSVDVAVIPSSSTFFWRDSPTVQPINGCASSDIRCRCWDFAGVLIDLDDSTCRNLATGVLPMPLDLNRFSDGRSGERGEREAPTPPVFTTPSSVNHSNAIALPSGVANSIGP